MELNRTLAKYSPYDNENNAFHAMQHVAFLIAELLMEQPKGTMTTPIRGHYYWVSPLNGMKEIVCSTDVPYIFTDNDCYNVQVVSAFAGLGVEELQAIRAGMEAWLADPQFVAAQNPAYPDSVVRRVYWSVAA